MSIIELDTLFYAPKTSSLQPQRASRSIRGKVFLNGCPLTLGKCVFRACVTKNPYPPPFCFKLRPDLVGFFLLFPHNFELKSSLRAFPKSTSGRSLSQTGPNSQFFKSAISNVRIILHTTDHHRHQHGTGNKGQHSLFAALLPGISSFYA